MNTETTNLPDVINIPTEVSDCPPIRIYGLSDLMRNAKANQATGTFFAEDGSTCAIAGALTELFDIDDLK